MNDEASRVSEAESLNWTTTAHAARVASYILEPVRDPKPGSPLADDDEEYPWEKCSAWMRSALVASLDHLILWANIVAPLEVFDGQIVRNPPRPYYTLARAGLESAAQAVWVLKPEESSERVQRHLRLLYHDLRHMANAFRTAGDAREPAIRERMESVRQRVADEDRFARIKNGEPRYSMMLGECADTIGMESSELEVLWRGASAAAHGKNWFQHVAYKTTVGEEYEPGYFRASLEPDLAEITRSLTAASRLAMYGVARFVTQAGHDLPALDRTAMSRLRSEVPLRTD